MVNFTPAPEAPIEPPEQEEAEFHIGRVIALVLATILAVLGTIVAGYALLTQHYLLLITAIGLFWYLHSSPGLLNRRIKPRHLCSGVS